MIKKDFSYNEVKSSIFKMVDGHEPKGFVFTTDPCGSFLFLSDRDKLIEIYATPNWVEQGQLMIQTYVDEEIISDHVVDFSRLSINRYMKLINNEIKNVSKHI